MALCTSGHGSIRAGRQGDRRRRGGGDTGQGTINRHRTGELDYRVPRGIGRAAARV